MKKKLLGLLFLLTAVAALLTVSAFAAQEIDPADYAIVESASYINPIYQNEDIDESELPKTAPTRRKLKATASSGESPYEATDREDAFEYMRTQMSQRIATMQFIVPSTPDETVGSIFKEYFEGACRHTGIPTQGDYIRAHVYHISVGVSNLVDGKRLVQFTFDYFTTGTQEAEADEAVAALVDEFSFTSETSEYDRIRTIYDYLCDNISYDKKLRTFSHSAYAALINHKAVCQGYASLFYRLALESGLQARYVVGLGNNLRKETSENHGWNIVAINGTYYYLDATWDRSQVESGASYIYFLRGTGDFTVYDSNGNPWSSHTLGLDEDGDGEPDFIPEECAQLSATHYALPLSIQIQPQDIDINVGDRANFRLAALGEGLTYAWYISGVSGPITNERFYVNLGTAYDGRTFYCVVKDAAGNEVQSETRTISVQKVQTKLRGHSISLDGDIAINYYVDIAEDDRDPDAVMHFTIPGETPKTLDIKFSDLKSSDYRVIPGDPTYHKCYIFSAPTAAKDMTQNVHAEFYTEDGTKKIDNLYRVKEYADRILEEDSGYSEEAQALVSDMLNYGGYAQTYFEYHTDDMANANLEDTSLPELDLASYVRTKSGSVEGLTFKGTRLIFRTKVLLWQYFEVNGDINDYTFLVDGTEMTPEPMEGKDNWYILKIDGVPAKNLRDFRETIVQKDGSADTLTINYSPYSYVYFMLQDPDTYGEAMVNLAKAMVVFGEQAYQYFQSLAA